MDCHIEIFIERRWRTAAVFEPDPQALEQGVNGGGYLQYDVDYAVEYLGNRSAETDGPHMDWRLLEEGAGAPPGNLRIAEAVPSPPSGHFRFGFHRRAIIEQGERFLDYAEERGVYVAEASSVQGEAPKYLLVEDHAGRFHAEGALPDEKARGFWLVKFPRGRRTDQRNQQVLKNESPYLEVARDFGIRTGEALVYEEGALFVPRFDRKVSNGRVERLVDRSRNNVAKIKQ
ncbi:MAG: HipA domain-containing protein [Desulfobacterales bacterium]